MTSWIVRDLIAEGALRVEDGNHGEYRPRPAEFIDEGVAFIRAADMTSGVVNFLGAGKINQTARERIRKGIGAPGDVILSHKGTVGRVAVAPLDAPDFVCSPQTTFWRSLKPEIVDQSYLRYFLESDLFQKQLKMYGGQTDMAPYVSLSDQRTLSIVLPPVNSQRGIAATLGALDDKIESNRRVMELSSSLLDALAADAAAELPLARFGDFVEKAKDTCTPAKFGNQPVDHYSLPAFDQGERPERVPAADIMSNKLVVPGRSILLSRLNPRINRIWWATPRDGLPALASTEFLCLRAQDDEDLAATWLAVRTEEFLTELPQRVTGTSGSHQRVRPEDVLDIPVPDMSLIPAETKQAALALLERREQVNDEIADLESLRNALLPELLLGRIRVPEAESIAEGVIA